METIERLKALVRMDSSKKEVANKAVRWAAREILDAGIEGTFIEDDGYVSFVSTIGKGPKTLVFNGHLDVVSGKPGQFEPREEGGRLYGRGTADMKAGVSAIIGAYLALSRQPLSCRVMLQLVPDEEIGGFHGTAALVKAGYLGDFAICTEPTNLAVGIQSKGIMRLQIKSRGRPAHGSRPWEGENAILKGLDNYERILRLPIMCEASAFYSGSSANLARISGGDIYNRVPDESTMNLDIRYVPHLDPQQILQAIAEAVEGEVILRHMGPGVNNHPDDPHIRQLTASIERVAGKEQVLLLGQHGSADTRFFAKEGIAAVEFGPVGADWHGDEEYVEMASVYALEAILVDLARRFM